MYNDETYNEIAELILRLFLLKIGLTTVEPPEIEDYGPRRIWTALAILPPYWDDRSERELWQEFRQFVDELRHLMDNIALFAYGCHLFRDDMGARVYVSLYQ